MVDIFDPSVPPETPLTLQEVIAHYGLKSTSGLRKAILAGRIPPESDRLGPKGARRWFVGLVRDFEQKKFQAAQRRQSLILKRGAPL